MKPARPALSTARGTAQRATGRVDAQDLQGRAACSRVFQIRDGLRAICVRQRMPVRAGPAFRRYRKEIQSEVVFAVKELPSRRSWLRRRAETYRKLTGSL